MGHVWRQAVGLRESGPGGDGVSYLGGPSREGVERTHLDLDIARGTSLCEAGLQRPEVAPLRGEHTVRQQRVLTPARLVVPLLVDLEEGERLLCLRGAAKQAGPAQPRPFAH